MTPTVTEAQDAAAAPHARSVTAVYPLDGVSTSADGALIVDRNLPGLWKFSLASDQPQGEVLVQGSPQYRKPLNSPRCVAMGPGGEIYLGDTATREVYRVAADGSTEPLTGGMIGVPVDLAVDSKGTLYIADLERRAVWRWDPAGGGKPEVWLAKANARGLAVDSQDRVWVLSQNAAQLLRYNADGQETVIVDQRIFNFPHNVCVEENGVAWVSDGYAKTVWKVEEGKPPVRAIESPLLQNPVGLFWHEGRLAIVDPHAAAVFRLSEDRTQLEPWFAVNK